MPLFGRRSPSKPRATIGSQVAGNMLPSDNIYTKAAMGANQTFKQRGWGVRVGAVRMLMPGEHEVALIVATDESAQLPAALDALPGSAEVLEPVANALRPFGHRVDPQYFAESDWPAIATSPAWRYHDGTWAAFTAPHTCPSVQVATP